MNKLIVANWKMNPGTLKEAISLARKTGAIKKETGELVLCPPYPFLSGVGKVLQGAALGAQDASISDSGPYTGEVSPTMLKSLGVEYVILGHSERRREFGETDGLVNRKTLAALRTGLRVVLCVGESLEVRKRGISAARSFVRQQLLRCIRGVGKGGSSKRNLIVAYEPVWAISTSKNRKDETPEDTARMILFIKDTLGKQLRVSAPRVLYGGSVDEKDVCNFLSRSEVDGVLVGGASLRPGEFVQLTKDVFTGLCDTLKL